MGAAKEPDTRRLSGAEKFKADKKDIAQRNDAVQRAARKLRTAREAAATKKRRRMENQ
jgi:hypothetical protein